MRSKQHDDDSRRASMVFTADDIALQDALIDYLRPIGITNRTALVRYCVAAMAQAKGVRLNKQESDR